MNIRKKRISIWIIILVLAALLIIGEDLVHNMFFSEKIPKTPITVCAPEDMESSFKKVLKCSELKSDYKIVMTSDSNSNVCVDYAKENDPSYIKFAFSPLIIAYGTDSDYYKSLKKSEVLIPSEFDDEYYDIDFFKVINEVLGEGQWSNLGIKDLKNIKIFYPSKETPYWNDFYDFMLVTINNGIYPRTEDELDKANEIIQNFIQSAYTEEVSNFDEKIERVGGFPDNAFFILPEKIATDLSCNHRESVQFLYPLNTVYFNYYVKGDEIGNQLISSFKSEDFFGNSFYSLLNQYDYRSEQESELYSISDIVYGERDIYNVSKIPINKVKELPNE